MTDRLAFSITEAATAVGVSRPTLYRWMSLPGFPVVRVGKVVRIPVRAFENWLDHQAGADSDDMEVRL